MRKAQRRILGLVMTLSLSFGAAFAPLGEAWAKEEWEESFILPIEEGEEGNLDGEGDIAAEDEDRDNESDISEEAMYAGNQSVSGIGYAIPDGDYELVSAMDTSYHLNVSEGSISLDSGADVSLSHRADPTETQASFTLTYLDNGFYSIKMKGSDMSLDAVGGANDGQNTVQMRAFDNSIGQQWSVSFEQFDGQYKGYRIQARSNGMSLDAQEVLSEIGKNIQLCSKLDEDRQGWLLIPCNPSQPVSEGRYILLSEVDILDENKLELDVEGDSPEVSEDANIQIWHDEECLSRYNSFDLKALENGYYKLIHHVSGKALTLYEGSLENHANISLHSADGSDSQQWAITEEGAGYLLRSRCSGLIINLESGEAENGANVEQDCYTGSASQIWHFVPAEYTVSYDANGGTGAPEPQIKYYKEAVVISSQIPVREGYEFKIWHGKDGAHAIGVKPGEAMNGLMTEHDVMLFAEWEKASEAYPPSSNLNKFASLSEGTIVVGQKADVSEFFGETYKMYKITETSVKGAASVSSKGILTGKKAGEIVVAGYEKDGKEWIEADSAQFTIEKPSFAEKTHTATIAYETIDLNEFLRNTTCSPDNWLSDKQKVAEVDKYGTATILGNGKTKITAVFGDGKNAAKYSFTLAVKIPYISKSKSSLLTGEKITLKLKNTNKTPLWTSTNPSVAGVNSKGVVTAYKGGYAAIKAWVDGVSYSVSISVQSPVLKKGKTTLKYGETTTLSLKKTKFKKITWQSCNNGIVKVVKGGKVKAMIYNGAATLTAYADGHAIYQVVIWIK
ncbi:MAG: RICIN domain-containing protein [Lachnospiraceae bacterium]|nr:RICIN domain-containing protein [Lachnospiraceae bacterium]